VECAKALTSSKTREEINGQVFHIADFDENHEYFRETLIFENHGKTYIFPTVISYLIAWICDIISIILFKLFSIHFGAPMTTFGMVALKGTILEYTFNSNKFQTMIGYNPPQSKDQAIEETKKWLKRYQNKYHPKKISSSS